MKEVNIKSLLLSILFVCIAAWASAQKEKGFTINGTVSGIPDQQIYLELVNLEGENELIQTTKIVNGQFTFNAILAYSPALLNIKLEDNKIRLGSSELGTQPGKGNILAENGFDIQIKIASDVNIAVVNDSPSYQRVLSLRKFLTEKFDTPMSNVQAKLMGLNIDWSKNPKPEDLSEDIRTKLLEYRTEVRMLAEGKRDYIQSYIKSNNNDISSIFCFLELRKSPYPFARAEESWPGLFNGLSDEVKRSHLGQIYKATLDKNDLVLKMAKSVSVGKSFKDFTLKDVSGKEIKISSCLKKGQYVLLDFWASWCGPCRAENPNVLKVYDKYHEKGFDVVAVSLDESKEAWEKAIAADKMPWTQLSDLKGWKSDIVAAYGITGIPANFLLDENGTIIATNLRGDNLGKKIEELLK